MKPEAQQLRQKQTMLYEMAGDLLRSGCDIEKVEPVYKECHRLQKMIVEEVL